VKRKYREAMRAAARERNEPPDDDDEAIEARDWHDEWTAAVAPAQQDEADKHYRSHK